MAFGWIYRCLVGREGGFGEKLTLVFVLEDFTLPSLCPVAQDLLRHLKVGSKELPPRCVPELGAGTGMFLKTSSLGRVLPGFKGSLDLIAAQSFPQPPCRGEDAKESPPSPWRGRARHARRMEGGSSQVLPGVSCVPWGHRYLDLYPQQTPHLQPTQQSAKLQLSWGLPRPSCSALLCSARGEDKSEGSLPPLGKHQHRHLL